MADWSGSQKRNGLTDIPKNLWTLPNRFGYGSTGILRRVAPVRFLVINLGRAGAGAL